MWTITRQYAIYGNQHQAFRAAITQQEEKSGLLNGDFGFWKRDDWEAILRTHGLRQRGHQIVRRTM